ncbi:MAB_1171c family putative transporter [Streptomyces sp. NBC_00328]|uniref:MAB_1171c family putative transporter n=1 Tax=Streptomyces sp. NBC_00328 TaxID=2903646 RepID=UPI002E2E028E|nr:MAB_1171c family putative transporter [Streptomyces sp. NBC_00328]
MSGLINYVSCGVLWLGLTVRAPDLVRHWRDPILRTVCAVMALAGLCFLLGAPPTVGAINRVSGIPNLAAPLTYASITAYSAMSLVLIIFWKGGPDVRRIARLLMGAYCVVLVLVAVLFALGDAPTERRTDFDTYYAMTPFIAEMIVLYLLAHLAAVVTTALWSLRWAREVHGRLRTGLLTMGAGTVVGAGYSVSKLTAVVARWCGPDWSALGTEVSPGLAGLSALLTVTGILIPWAGPSLTAWLHSWRAYVGLAPLERELDGVLAHRNLRLPRPRPSSPATLLMWRQTSIHNALSYLDALFDRDLYERTHDATLLATGDRERAQAAGWAAIIAAAVRMERSGQQAPGSPGGSGPTLPAPDASALVRIAEALTTSGSLPDTPVLPGPSARGAV